ncbi:hypothetical protein OG381_46625 [Streptomyces sp. NBC_00490]|uniref:hypothetical protein n=1 Tax=Streptomyces sp. NBC_00490 TaxID=2903657 RepID=UPI002E17CED4
MGLLIELQKRIPDGWFLRRLLPAVLFFVVAVVGGGELGHAHWNDVPLAREEIADALRTGGGLTADTVASFVLFAVPVVAAAFAVPYLASGIGALAAGAWPWWLMPVGDLLTRWRRHRWVEPDELARRSLRASADGNTLRAARLDVRGARARENGEPGSPTWSGDRFHRTEESIRQQGGDLVTGWTTLVLGAQDPPRAALAGARDAYDAACEALVWSAAFTLVGAWWWPAAPVGVLLGLASWRTLRHAVEALCRTTEAAFTLRETQPPPAQP